MSDRKEKKIPIPAPGLDQTFKIKEGKIVALKDFLDGGDWWELKSRTRIAYIVSHDAVKKIAIAAGISTAPDYTVLTQPSTTNGYTYLIQCKVTDHEGRQTIELGESSRNNLGSRGRNNPANMAQKRAFDRAVFLHLGITGLLGEDELPDEDEKMDKLTPEESKQIAPLINKIFAAKGKPDLVAFRTDMKKVTGLKDEQLNVLRGLWKKKLAEFEKSF